jgi:hypothetical protein
LVKPAQDRARELAAEQIVAASGQRHDVRRRWRVSEIRTDPVCCVAVAREIGELKAELARELEGVRLPV